MNFIRVEGTEGLEDALASTLNTALASGKSVLWLVPGGSNIASCVKVMDRLDIVNLHRLTLMLTDERYGEPGHKDSNFYQLHEVGLEERGAVFLDLLKGKPLEETVHDAAVEAQRIFSESETIVGFFGLGPDGHIAGILPHSPAATKDDTWVIGYDAGQYKRITLTPFALSHVQIAYVGAFGAEKSGALNNLCNKMLPMAEQPAQILCHVPEVYIFNDQIGATV